MGITSSTLERWRSEALATGAPRTQWSSAARFDALLATSVMSEEERSAWCRSKGIFPSDLEEWKGAARTALEAPDALGESSDSAAQRRRIRELERDLRRKEKALAETAALLVLSKKAEAIFRGDEGE
ncbi:MAG: transposase [Fibrobacteria bacterium]|nr:transposase [Fibrobacteria bacterium]